MLLLLVLYGVVVVVEARKWAIRKKAALSAAVAQAAIKWLKAHIKKAKKEKTEKKTHTERHM